LHVFFFYYFRGTEWRTDVALGNYAAVATECADSVGATMRQCNYFAVELAVDSPAQSVCVAATIFRRLVADDPVGRDRGRAFPGGTAPRGLSQTPRPPPRIRAPRGGRG